MENQTKTPEEIYERLLDMVALTQQLWMLDSDDGYVTISIPEGNFLPLWTDEASAAAFAAAGQKPVAHGVGQFFLMCEQIYADILGFAVSPTKEGITLVTAAALLNDLEDRLGLKHDEPVQE